jgi:hypothetical protein
MTVKMYAPFLGQGAKLVGSNGVPISVDANKTANIAEEDVLALLKQGFTLQTGMVPGAMPMIRRTVHSNAANSTLAANAMIWGEMVVNVISGGAALTHTTATSNNMAACIPGIKNFDRWLVRLINKNSGNLTLAPGAGVNFNDVAGNNASIVIAANKYVDLMGMYENGNISFADIGQGNAV